MYPFPYNDSQNKPEEVLFSGFNLNSSQSPQGGFGLTPNRLTFDKNITDFAARLFPVLVSLSNNEKGYCFVTNKVLCDWFGFGITKMQEAIKNLKEVNCSVVGDYESAKASECEEPLKTDEILSYKDKYISGGKKIGGTKSMNAGALKLPAEIENDVKLRIQELALKTCVEGILTGNYLTTTGKSPKDDIKTVKKLGRVLVKR